MAELRIEVIPTLQAIPAAQWDGCVASDYPFLQHAFLAALEDSGSVAAERGWHVQHVLVWQRDQLCAVLPLYRKTHSWGEYVFDQEWAAAYHRHGLSYYPKWLSAIPFSPVTGPRLAVHPSAQSLPVRETLFAWLTAQLADQRVSGWHLLFCDATEAECWQALGAGVRVGCQFHWRNQQYASFSAFLAGFTARKRKSVQRERRLVSEQGVVCERKTGAQMTAADWQWFYQLYASTYQKRGHQPHLAPGFFTRLAAAMPEQVLVDWAWQADQPIAAALFLRDAKTLYGRYWGCAREVSGLHFELCFYRGIEYCIAHGLARFDPGAQGEHKISRGFEPVTTYSCHWITHPGFRDAIADFLHQEQGYLDAYREQAASLLPFRRDS